MIFKTRDEYLKKGSGPPVEWSGGQFTGGSVETYVGDGGFEEMAGTLFHEARTSSSRSRRARRAGSTKDWLRSSRAAGSSPTERW